MKLFPVRLSNSSKKQAANKILFMIKTTVLYVLCYLLLVSFKASSQDKVTLISNDIKLLNILQEIEKQTEYKFVYNNDEINIYKTYNLNLIDVDIHETLKYLFKDRTINFQIRKNYIILNSQPISSSATLSGTLKDSETGETLMGASIIVKSLNQGAISNEYGFYSLTLSKGSYTISVSYVGYQSIDEVVDLNTDLSKDFELEPLTEQLAEVIVKANMDNKSQVQEILSGVSNMSVSEIKKLPTFFGETDINRAVLTLPGVSSVGEGTAGFNVRGGNIDQNLTLLDEAPMYLSSHLWGLFSVVNADGIKDITLYKGSIPARYGGRASSVLDIRQREGNTKSFKGQGGIGNLFSRLTLEGPILKDKVNFLISGRRSYFDAFFPLFGDELKNNKFFFYDLNTKLTWKINNKNKIFASGYFGSDVMKLTENDFEDSDEIISSIDFQWNNATGTIRWNHLFSNKLFMNLSTIYSSYSYKLTGTDNENIDDNIKWRMDLENWIVKPDFTYYLNPTTKLRFGVNNTLYRYKPANLTNIEGDGEIESFPDDNGLEVAPYFEWEKKWNKLSINAGLRYSVFANIGATVNSIYPTGVPRTPEFIVGEKSYGKGEVVKMYSGLEPRIAVNYNLSARKALKLSFNRNYQYVHLITNTSAPLPFDVWKLSGPFIKPVEANQISGGYSYDTSDDIFNVNIEGFYKKFKNLVEYKNGADLLVQKNIETQIIPADGFSYGAELSLYKNKGRLTGNTNYTYSVSKRKTKSKLLEENLNNGKFYPSNFDRPHILNTTVNYALSEKWDLNAFFTYQTGRPYTEMNGRLNIDGEPFLTYSNRNAYRLSDTHRLDLSLTYNPIGNPRTKWKSSWSFGIYNVYSRENVFTRYPAFLKEGLKTIEFSLLGAAIPHVTYNFKF